MAIQKTIIYKGLTIENSYGKITNLHGTKELVNYEISFFANANLSKYNDNIIESNSFCFVPNQNDESVRWDKQAYEHLRTLDEYKDAIDVLD